MFVFWGIMLKEAMNHKIIIIRIIIKIKIETKRLIDSCL